MCWSRTNCSENVMESSCWRRCNFRCDCKCRCNCNWWRDSVAGEANRIALRGPGCISGTGRCDSSASDSVRAERGFDSFCGQVSPSGNTQSEGLRRRRCDCSCFNRCLNELLEDIFENANGCPR